MLSLLPSHHPTQLEPNGVRTVGAVAVAHAFFAVGNQRPLLSVRNFFSDVELELHGRDETARVLASECWTLYFLVKKWLRVSVACLASKG